MITLARESSSKPPANILHWIREEFNLPLEYAEQCSQYYLRVWDGIYVHGNVIDGQLITNDGEWNVHWQSSPMVVKTAKKVAVSFREYKGVKYAVVKVW